MLFAQKYATQSTPSRIDQIVKKGLTSLSAKAQHTPSKAALLTQPILSQKQSSSISPYLNHLNNINNNSNARPLSGNKSSGKVKVGRGIDPLKLNPNVNL